MSSVFDMINKPAVKSRINPNDVETIVSILPKRIKETKITVDPPDYIIEPGTFENPSILHVGTGVSWIDPGHERQYLEQIIPAAIISESVIRDYSSGLPGIKNGAGPGLFAVEGRRTVEYIKKNHEQELIVARERQKRWFQNLVEITDIDWAQTNGNPRSVLQDARMAAEYLGLKDKPWLRDAQILKMENCPNCGTLRNPQFPTCASCGHIIDQEKYNSLNLQKVK